MRTLSTLACAAALLLGATSANAALVDRGGGMIYDTVLNITWLQDWNYAKTSGYDSDGLMTWTQANTWANNLVYGGYDDWRLPTMVDTGTAGCNFSYVGGTDCGYNVQTKSGGTVYSEMAHLYYETLGNKAYCFPGSTTCSVQSGWGLKNTGLFSNMQSSFYWFGLEFGPVSSWIFGTNLGNQGHAVKSNEVYAVAVRPGDVAAAVPEPQTWALTLLALGAAVGVRRQRPR